MLVVSSPVNKPIPGAVETHGSPLVLVILFDCRMPDRTEVSFSRRRMVCSILRLLRMGMPLMLDPVRLLISNCSCSVTSSSPWSRGVAFTFNPKSSYSADGYPVWADAEPAKDGNVFSVTVTVLEAVSYTH